MREILIIIFSLWLVGCDNIFSSKTASETTVLRATCHMNNFKDFPKKVTGPVTLELKSFITILVKNEDDSESVEMTFPKSKCGVK